MPLLREAGYKTLIWFFIVLALLLAAPPAFYYGRLELASRRYDRCLRNIERLEREMGLDTTSLLGQRAKSHKHEFMEDFYYGPGAKWPVEDSNAVRVLVASGTAVSSSAATNNYTEIFSPYWETARARMLADMNNLSGA